MHFSNSPFFFRTGLSEVDPNKQDEYTPLTNIYLGVGVMEQLKHPSIVNDHAKIEVFKRACRGYLVELCRGIKQRFDFDDPLLKALPVLKATSAVSFADRSFSNSLLPFMDLVPRAKPADPAVVQRIDDQWRALPYDDFPQDLMDEEHLDVFWARVCTQFPSVVPLLSTERDVKFRTFYRLARCNMTTARPNTRNCLILC